MNTLKRITIFLFVLLLLAACGGGQTGGGTTPIKVGAIHDLTGATSDVGKPYADA